MSPLHWCFPCPFPCSLLVIIYTDKHYLQITKRHSYQCFLVNITVKLDNSFMYVCIICMQDQNLR